MLVHMQLYPVPYRLYNNTDTVLQSQYSVALYCTVHLQ